MGVLYLICWRRNYPQDRGTRPNVGGAIKTAGVRILRIFVRTLQTKLTPLDSLFSTAVGTIPSLQEVDPWLRISLHSST